MRARAVLAALLLALALAPTARATDLPLAEGSKLILSGTSSLTDGLPHEVAASQVTGGAVSADGTIVAFASHSDGLVAGTADDATQQVFRKDRVTGELKLASLDSTGAPATADCGDARIAAGGGAVAFACAGRLTAADTDDEVDVYLRWKPVLGGIQRSERTTLVTTGTSSAVGAFDLSGDGRRVVIESFEALVPEDTNNRMDIYARDLDPVLGAPEWRLVSRRTGESAPQARGAARPTISDDGTTVAYSSPGLDLIGTTEPTIRDHVFRTTLNGSSVVTALVDRTTAATVEPGLESVTGTPEISGDGTAVAFASLAGNLVGGDDDLQVDVFVREGATTTLVSAAATGPTMRPGIDGSGARVSYLDTASGIHVRTVNGPDVVVAEFSGVASNVGALYASGSSLSADGDVVVHADRGLLPRVDPEADSVFARTLSTGITGVVSRPAGSAPFVSTTRGAYVEGPAALSADGTRAVILARRMGLPGVIGRTIAVRDLRTGGAVVAGRADGPAGEIDQDAQPGTISADGRRVAWVTPTSLDRADQDQELDVYVRDLEAQRTWLASVADDGRAAVARGSELSLSATGDRVTFLAAGRDVAPGDASDSDTTVIRDLAAGRTLLASAVDGQVQAVSGRADEARLSWDGRRVVFTADAANVTADDRQADGDVFVRDLDTGATTLLDPGADTTAHAPQISGDGRIVAFLRRAGTGDEELVVRDLQTGASTVAGRGDGPQGPPARSIENYSLSADGTTVAFATQDGLGLPNTTAASGRWLIRDLTRGRTTLGPTDASGQPLASRKGALSATGACLVVAEWQHTQVLPPPAYTSPDGLEVYLQALRGGCGSPVQIAPAVAGGTSSAPPAGAAPGGPSTVGAPRPPRYPAPKRFGRQTLVTISAAARLTRGRLVVTIRNRNTFAVTGRLRPQTGRRTLREVRVRVPARGRTILRVAVPRRTRKVTLRLTVRDPAANARTVVRVSRVRR